MHPSCEDFHHSKIYKNHLSNFNLTMKKFVLVVAILVLAISFTSCASRKKGCGLTAENQELNQQETVVGLQ